MRNHWCQFLTNKENSSQEKQDTPSSSAASFCELEIFPKLTIAEEQRLEIDSSVNPQDKAL